MNSYADHFNPVLRKMEENEEKLKKCNPSSWSTFICTSCEEKITNLQYVNLFFEKILHKMDYNV